MKVLFTGGGTGGHLFPALAVADALKNVEPSTEILFVGASTAMEATAVPQAGYAFRGLPASGMPRRFGLRLFRASWTNLRSIWRARAIIDEFKPDAIFATGGFSSAPILGAARLRGVPVILHEQNSIPGLVNRLASRFAHEVHLTYSSSRRYFKKRGHLRLSGMPVRESVTSGSRSKALRLFRLNDGSRTVLVFGGSQGAKRINEATLDALPRFVGRGEIQFVIQAGQKDYTWMLDQCRSIQVRSWIRPFILNMGDAYAMADLVVCRAGALTLAELAATGKPAILIPYPHATANHQTWNAEAAVDAGAAIVIPDSELTGELLAKKITELFDQPSRLRMMSIQSMRLAKPQATERLVMAILRLGGIEPVEEKPAPPPRERQQSRGRRPARGRNVAHQGS